MRIRLRTTLAGPSGTFRPGQVVDLPNGAALVAAGYADAMEPAAAAPRIESATVPAAAERAVSPRGKRGR